MSRTPYPYFRPRRMASWWTRIDDLLWPERDVLDRIRRRADGFAEAGIDTAITFGFHIRFDFADYFGQLHGYLAAVCEALHERGIRFMDHYSCNTLERPRGDAELDTLHRKHRHHVLLHPDPIAAAHAQYEGHRFQEICEEDVRDGTRGYTQSYQIELFCHNNPQCLDMHGRYLRRLLREVPLDGFQIDDMCDYGGLATCGCRYCRQRFAREYGHELPPVTDSSFWGDTSGHPTTWGNYEHPVFRDWIRMRADSVADHVRLVKESIGDLPLMTCCSSTGPMRLNAIALDLERMAPHLDLVMLENCGINVHSASWTRMDAEALQQKDIAAHMGNAPAVALSYTIFDAGGYLGWALARFWGTANWSSTLFGRLEAEPQGTREIHEIVGPVNAWERQHSDLDPTGGADVVEIRLVSNRLCRLNGFRDHAGREHWDRVHEWSMAFVEHNVGYRFVRAGELADGRAIEAGATPLVLDGVASVSDAQHAALTAYLENGGVVWLRLPYGTLDERGFPRKASLAQDLAGRQFPGLVMLPDVPPGQALEERIATDGFRPRLTGAPPGRPWALRLRVHGSETVLHLLNRQLQAVPDAELVDRSGVPILRDVHGDAGSGSLVVDIDTRGIPAFAAEAVLTSPELDGESAPVQVTTTAEGRQRLTLDTSGLRIYGVVQRA